MKEKDLSGEFPNHSLNYSDLTKTISEVLDIDGISEEIKEELKKHPDNYCVLTSDCFHRIFLNNVEYHRQIKNNVLYTK